MTPVLAVAPGGPSRPASCRHPSGTTHPYPRGSSRGVSPYFASDELSTQRPTVAGLAFLGAHATSNSRNISTAHRLDLAASRQYDHNACMAGGTLVARLRCLGAVERQ